jgi:hypothetical protein
MHRVRLVARYVMFAALAAHAITALVVVVLRVRYPHDLEWMTGSVLDHVERVRAGQPIYTAPSARWIPFLYPPLYYWLGAALGGGAFACRMISVVAAIIEGVAVWLVARSLSATKLWSAAAVLVFIAAFPFVGFWYDIERSDTLFGAIVLGASAILLRARGVRGHVVAGLLFALGTLAKQQAVFYLAGAGAGLLLATRASDEPARRRDVAAFLVASGVPVVALFAIAKAGEGWASYYLLEMPSAHGILFNLAPGVVERDVPSGFLLFGVTLYASALVGLRVLRRTIVRRDVIAGAILAAGFAGAVASRLHIGGWINVLVPWTTCAAVAVGVVGSRIEEHSKARPWAAPLVAALIVAQLVVWAYDPGRVIPRPGSDADEQRLISEVAVLEREGEVLMPARGHITRVRHFHLSALADVARVEGHSPPDLVRGLRERTYAAIVDDARYDSFRPTDWPPTILEDIDDLRTPLLAGYYVAKRIDYGTRALALRSPATPAWIYRPRRAVLDVAPEELRRRQLAEMRLAETRAKAIAQGTTPSFTEAEIEDLAARSDALTP